MWLFIEPFDVWMFRDGKPFTAGEQTRATGFFPPLPTTFQGVIRTAGLVRALGASTPSRSFADFNRAQRQVQGPPDGLVNRWGRGSADFGRFSMRGPFITREHDGIHEALLPAPRDLVVRKGPDAREAQKIFVQMRARPVATDRVVRGGLEAVSAARTPAASETGEDPLVSPPWPRIPHVLELPQADTDDPHKLEEGPAFLPIGTFAKYLVGDLHGQTIDEPDRHVVPDLRVGIERNRERGTAEYGRLYLAHFQRPENGVGLAVEVWFASDGADGSDRVGQASEQPLPDTGVLGIGGEARAGRYRTLNESPLAPRSPDRNGRRQAPIDDDQFQSELAARLRGSSRFKIVLVAPAVFPHGWCPPFVDPATLEGMLAGARLRLVAAVVGKPVPITGWDYATSGPKRLEWAVPPGSTYTFEVLEAPDDWARGMLLPTVHGRSIAVDENGGARWGAAIGMALAFVSVV